MLNSSTDYYKNASRLLQSDERRKLAFDFIKQKLEEGLAKNDPKILAFWLGEIRHILAGDVYPLGKNPAIKKSAMEWFRDQVDLIERICKTSLHPFSRRESLYLLLKYLPTFGEEAKSYMLDHLINVYILIFHTVNSEELSAKEGYEKAWKTAIRGAYRWNVGWIVKNWVAEAAFLDWMKSLPDEAKEPFTEIIGIKDDFAADFRKETHRKREDDKKLLLLSFLNAFTEDRLELFEQEGSDVASKLFNKFKENLKELFYRQVTQVIPNGEEGKVIKSEIWAIIEERFEEWTEKDLQEIKRLKLKLKDDLEMEDFLITTSIYRNSEDDFKFPPEDEELVKKIIGKESNN